MAFVPAELRVPVAIGTMMDDLRAQAANQIIG